MKQSKDNLIAVNITVCTTNAPYDIYIGREMTAKKLPGYPWQNPFKLSATPTDDERAVCLKRYREYVVSTPHLMRLLRAGELIGKRLACWCKKTPDDPKDPPEKPFCHGDVLRELQAEYAEVLPQAVPDAPMPAQPPAPAPEPSGKIIAAKIKGDIISFPGSATIVKRIVYRETIGATVEGKPVAVACAYNKETETNIWFVCIVAVGPELWAVKSCGQIKTCANVRAMAEGWMRETATQLRKIQQAAGFMTFIPDSRGDLETGITSVWPEAVPKDAKPQIPAEAGSSTQKNVTASVREPKKITTQDQKEREVKKASSKAETAATLALFD